MFDCRCCDSLTSLVGAPKVNYSMNIRSTRLSGEEINKAIKMYGNKLEY